MAYNNSPFANYEAIEIYLCVFHSEIMIDIQCSWIYHTARCIANRAIHESVIIDLLEYVSKPNANERKINCMRETLFYAE